jgi:hypothetical protein
VLQLCIEWCVKWPLKPVRTALERSENSDQRTELTNDRATYIGVGEMLIWARAKT